MAANTDASVALTFTTRDQASPGIQRIGGNLSRLQSTAAGVGKVFANNATAFLTAGLALSSIGGQASSLLVKFGVLSETQGDVVNTIFQVSAVVLGAVTAFSSLALAISAGSIGFSAIAASAVIALPIILALGAALATVVTLGQLLRDPTAPTTFEQITGIDVLRTKQPAGTRPGRLAPGEAAFGEDPLAAAGGVGRDIGRQLLAAFGIGRGGQPRILGAEAGGVTINAGTIIADEGGMRDLEKRLRQIRKEDERTRGISK